MAKLHFRWAGNQYSCKWKAEGYGGSTFIIKPVIFPGMIDKTLYRASIQHPTALYPEELTDAPSPSYEDACEVCQRYYENQLKYCKSKGDKK